jgi:hypothetical protein
VGCSLKSWVVVPAIFGGRFGGEIRRWLLPRLQFCESFVDNRVSAGLRWPFPRLMVAVPSKLVAHPSILAGLVPSAGPREVKSIIFC